MSAFYIAARFSRRPEANSLANKLQAMGHTITSRWVRPGVDHVLPTGLSRQAADGERRRFAEEDFDDVKACDCMVSLMEEPRSNSRGGRHVEFGMAAALGRRLVVIGPRETVFHHLANVEHFETADQFLAAFQGAGGVVSGQHTPGPWEWQTPMGDHCPWIVKGGQKAYEWEPIATLGDCTEDGPSPRSKAFREIQANARLIATAPDLVEALQKTVASLEDCVKRLRVASKFAGNHDWAIDGLCEQFETRLTDARTTISKALGEGAQS